MVQKITSYEDLPVDDMLDAYGTSWDEETKDGYGQDPDEKPGEIKDAGYDLVRLYRKQVAPRIQPEIVELPIQFKINGQPYSGQIDLGHRVFDPATRSSKLVIRDTKTTARMPQESQYLLNMSGYAISQRQVTGEIEADTVLDYLVATKTPQYKELRMGGPITDQQIRRFSAVVGAVAESIKAERYVPNGLTSGACTWCGVQSYCPAYLGKES